jgi:integrase/recombinase XerC
MVRAARVAGDRRPSFELLAACLADLSGQRSAAGQPAPSLPRDRDEWLLRLESARRSASAVTGYRVALDDLIGWVERTGGDPFQEQVMVAYLADYLARRCPAPATYYRHFVLVRAFVRWVTRRYGLIDPFLDLDAPPKPRQQRDWLTHDEFARMLAAAGQPRRNLPGLAARDRLVLLALVVTGLRRSELCAVRFGDLRLDGDSPSLLVRHGKGDRPRRQALAPALAAEIAALRDVRGAGPDAPVFCGLKGGPLQTTILADIIRRCALRAGIEKHVTAHTLRHTGATWLREETADARLVAEYLGHADLSTVSRYTHVTEPELRRAAATIERIACSAA